MASKEILGYGFPLDEVQKQLDRAGEGQTIQVDFQILYPKQWKALLEKDLFRDVLAEKKTAHTDNADRTRNLELACAAIDGMDINGLVGSLAGDDTALLIMRTNEAAAEFCNEIHKMLK